MWNDSYREYVRDVVLSQRSEYPYYLAVTCTYWDSMGSYNAPNFKIYMSKTKITALSLYSYELPADTLVYSVIGGNANRNNHDNRVSVSSAEGRLNIDDYEFVYTNAEFATKSVQPDLLRTNSVSQSHFDGFGIAILICLLGVLFFRLIRR